MALLAAVPALDLGLVAFPAFAFAFAAFRTFAALAALAALSAFAAPAAFAAFAVQGVQVHGVRVVLPAGCSVGLAGAGFRIHDHLLAGLLVRVEPLRVHQQVLLELFRHERLHAAHPDVFRDPLTVPVLVLARLVAPHLFFPGNQGAQEAVERRALRRDHFTEDCAAASCDRRVPSPVKSTPYLQAVALRCCAHDGRGLACRECVQARVDLDVEHLDVLDHVGVVREVSVLVHQHLVRDRTNVLGCPYQGRFQLWIDARHVRLRLASPDDELPLIVLERYWLAQSLIVHQRLATASHHLLRLLVDGCDEAGHLLQRQPRVVAYLTELHVLRTSCLELYSHAIELADRLRHLLLQRPQLFLHFQWCFVNAFGGEVRRGGSRSPSGSARGTPRFCAASPAGVGDALIVPTRVSRVRPARRCRCCRAAARCGPPPLVAAARARAARLRCQLSPLLRRQRLPRLRYQRLPRRVSAFRAGSWRATSAAGPCRLRYHESGIDLFRAVFEPPRLR